MGSSYILMPTLFNDPWPFSLFVFQLNPPGLLTMPRSPTSSEDEMAQSFSDYSDDCASDSSREETIYETIRATAEPSQNRMDDIHTNSLVVRILIPDLQQTVGVEMMCWCVMVWESIWNVTHLFLGYPAFWLRSIEMEIEI